MEMKLSGTLEYTVCDFSKIERKTGYVTVRPISQNKKRDAYISLRTWTDHRKRIIYGIPTTKTDNKGMTIFSMIQISGHRMFDLSNERDRMEFHVLWHTPLMKGGPNQGHNPVLYVEDPERDARIKAEKRKQSRSFEDILDAMSDEDVKAIAPMFGLDEINNSAVILREQILEYCQRSPGKGKELLTDKQAAYATKLINLAVRSGGVNIDPINGVSTRDGAFLGHDLNAAVYTVKNDANLQARISSMIPEEEKYRVSKPKSDEGFGDEEEPNPIPKKKKGIDN